MAKRVHKVSYKGDLDANRGTITEKIKVNKEEIEVEFSLTETLHEFHGKKVSISISEESDVMEDAPEEKGVEISDSRH